MNDEEKRGLSLEPTSHVSSPRDLCPRNGTKMVGVKSSLFPFGSKMGLLDLCRDGYVTFSIWPSDSRMFVRGSCSNGSWLREILTPVVRLRDGHVTPVPGSEMCLVRACPARSDAITASDDPDPVY